VEFERAATLTRNGRERELIARASANVRSRFGAAPDIVTSFRVQRRGTNLRGLIGGHVGDSQ